MNSRKLFTLFLLLFSINTDAGSLSMIGQEHIMLTLVSFFGLGILLAFTPCVLPMVPILSTILVGQEDRGIKHSFSMSLVFVISMAVTYAAAGMLAGYLGSTVQTLLQTPAVIIAFSIVFVLMALSMFGVFHLSLPRFLHHRLHLANNSLKSGSYAGVALMGILSTLIAAPCVTAPLVSVLTFISETGNAYTGGLILFFLALGMGIPLILFGIGQSALLPNTGTWMNHIKFLFGVMILGLAIWMLSRVLNGNVIMYLSAALFIVSAIAFGTIDASKHLPPVIRGAGILILIYGIFLLAGAASGHTDILNPLVSSESTTETLTQRPPSALFKYASTASNLAKKLQEAKAAQKPVLIEFFATWCPDCKEVDNNVLSDAGVRSKMRQLSAIRVDVSERNPELAGMMEAYKVYGVPTMVFYDRNGNLFKADKLENSITKDGLLATLDQLIN